MANMNRNREKIDASQLEIKDTVVSINRRSVSSPPWT